MKLSDLIENLSLEVKTPETDLTREVTGGYVSDMLSDVIANAKAGYVWVTFQSHLNIVAVASLKGICGIIMVNNRVPARETILKAAAENIPIMTSSLTAFELVGKLYALGLRCL
ncbi:MAG TPA: hypothetical protein VLD55_12850 [Candidatus Sulfobium mesophilum]|nr:hypothetical protein [Candidatus Sulfobium mesophilum]